MKQQIFALSLGFAGLILATHNAFAQAAPHCAGALSWRCNGPQDMAKPSTATG